MISHRAEFHWADLMKIAGGPLAAAALLAGLVHVVAWLGVLPPPRPALDTDRTILIHQADAARNANARDLVVIGDSSCLMNVAARHLETTLQTSTINLGTLSYLDPAAYGVLLQEYTRRHSPRTVLLLMHPDALRRLSSESHHLTILTRYLAGQDDFRTASPSGWFNAWSGADIINGRLLPRLVPIPLRGAYGAYYGFARDLETYMTRHAGSAIDPGADRFPARAEYRLSPTLAAASQSFRAQLPAATQLLVGMSPLPASIAPPRFGPMRDSLLQEWARMLKAAALTNLPAVLPDTAFARVTHLKPSAVTNYTEQLAEALRASLP
jgi:hypothetical protein